MTHKQTQLEEEAHQSRGIDQDVQQDSAKLSSLQLLHRKRKASFHNSAEDYPKRVMLDDEDNNYYHKGGLVHSLHGNIYQLKLQMLFLKRALNNGYEFNLGTEVEDAEKFDDIVFKYKRKDQSRKDEIRFMQAKHKQDESKRITAHDLLTDKDDDFSLQKYFISYSKIKKKHGFNNGELKDFIIYTNIKFDSADLEKAEIKIEEMEANDDILDTKSNKSAVLTRLIIQKEHKLYEKLRETSDSYLLAKKLVQHISDGKPLQLSTDIFKLYHVALCGTVFQIQETKVQNKKGNFVPKKYVKFRDDFLNGNNLTEDVRNFRNVFQLVLKKQNDAFWQELNRKELRVTSNFGQIFKLERNPIISEPEILAEKIAEIINNAKPKTINIHRRTGIIKENIDKLAGHVLVQDEEDAHLMRFRKLFFNDDNKLPGNLEEFKDALKEAFEMKGLDFSVLRRYKYKISNFRTCEETLEGKLLYSKPTLPNDKVANEEITEFFEKLVFAVGQPNEVELGEIITKEIGEDSQFNVLNADLVVHSFQGRMLEWFKEKRPEKGKEGVWLNAESGKEFFDSIEQQVSSLISVGLSLPYFEKLQAYGISFDINNLLNKVKTFLSKESKIFHIITPKKTILSAINVYSALVKLKNQEEFAQYNQEDSYIFMRLNMLLRPNIKKRVMDAFKSKDNHNLLIIDCESEPLENQIQEIEELYNNLDGVIRSNKNKKIIFINTEDNDVLVKKFITSSTMYKSEVESSSFNDLTKESQQKLLERQIIFQGQKISLNKLIEESDERSKQIIDGNTLVQLISNKEIEIGSKPPGTSDLKGAYSEVFEEVEFTTFVDKLLLEKLSDVYIISGILGSDKESELIKSINGNMEVSKINDLKSQIALFNPQNIKRTIDPRIQVADDQFKEKDFKQICHNNPERKIYWIILKNEDDKSVFILAQIYNPDFYLNGQRFNNEVVIEKDIKEELINSILSEIFIIDVKDKSKVIEWLQFNIFEQTLFDKNCQNNKIQFDTSQHNLEVFFQDLIKQKNPNTYHLFKFGQNQLIWCRTHGSLENLRKYRCKGHRNTKPLIGEDDLIKEIEHKKVSIVAGDPGMGKSTTLVKLYGLKYELQSGIEESIIQSHWVIRINLKDHLEVIRNIDFSNGNPETEITRKITEFLSQIDESLSDDFARNLLSRALIKKHFTKPLLMVFDAFDEVLDEADRDKIISLLTLLKNTTEAKCWITTRLHYEPALEGALSTFAIKLDPMDELTTKKFIKKYLRNCLNLMLSQSEFKEIFSDEVVETSRVQEYTEAFLRVMREVFKDDVSEFIGTPLQLYLMLEGSTGHFKEWVRDNNPQSPDFSYLGNDIWEIYENFVDRKYKIYFKKADVTVALRQEQDKETIDDYHKDLAKSLIFKLKPKQNLKKFEDIVLSAGIVKSDGRDIDFIHPTFREYFAAKVLIHWIGKWKEENLNVFRQVEKKQEYVLKEILLKPDYKVIRAFLNAKLFKQKMANIQLPGEYYDKDLLFQTARENNVGIASFVLDNFKYVNVNVRDKAGNTFLWQAAKSGNLQMVEFLVTKGANVNTSNTYGTTVLHKFVEYDNLEMVEFLVTKGANVNATDTYGNTVLHRAAKSGNLRMVEFLVTKGANVNTSDTYGNTVLHMVVKYCNLEMVEILVTKGANVNATNNWGKTVLHMAIESDNLEMVKFLVTKDAFVNTINKDSKKVLHRASNSGTLRIVEFLVTKGANVNATDTYGNTVLHRAAKSGNLRMVEFLVTKGANVNTSDTYGNTVLHMVVKYGNLQMVEFLVTTGANVNATDKWGNTVLYMAVEYGYLDMVEFLVTKGAIVNTANRVGDTVLHSAAKSGNLRMVEFLVTKGTNVDTSDTSGNTVLHMAVKYGNLEMVEFLVRKGANVSAINEDSNTVLHMAIESGNLEMVKFLITKGVNIAATNKYGKTVLCSATIHGKLEVVEFLASKVAIDDATNKDDRMREKILERMIVCNIDLKFHLKLLQKQKHSSKESELFPTSELKNGFLNRDSSALDFNTVKFLRNPLHIYFAQYIPIIFTHTID
ncbi:hypothetical protein ABEB36_010995 [Hypothenemus hampei]|uniref:NACHT domain-containing protein n=1 Tax=Hypothenemus hampei TaxID=57062 RepID=A0ABD1EDU5_HYPHA